MKKRWRWWWWWSWRCNEQKWTLFLLFHSIFSMVLCSFATNALQTWCDDDADVRVVSYQKSTFYLTLSLSVLDDVTQAQTSNIDRHCQRKDYVWGEVWWRGSHEKERLSRVLSISKRILKYRIAGREQRDKRRNKEPDTTKKTISMDITRKEEQVAYSTSPLYQEVVNQELTRKAYETMRPWERREFVLPGMLLLVRERGMFSSSRTCT